jgi:predicted anti-sigma-YlaC factor YlaD
MSDSRWRSLRFALTPLATSQPNLQIFGWSWFVGSAHPTGYPNFSEQLLLIAIPWGITAPMSMLLLAIMFKKDAEVSTQMI